MATNEEKQELQTEESIEETEAVANTTLSESLSEEPENEESMEEVVTEEPADLVESTVETDDENPTYSASKEQNHRDVVDLIQTAEIELADLKLRKYLMEANFTQLLDSYRRYLIQGISISPLAKTSLVEYFTYELLKPLNPIGLRLSQTTYDTWETRHFLITYALDEQKDLFFSFQLPSMDQKYQATSIPLLRVSPQTMEVEVKDREVLDMIRKWSVNKIYSSGQLTIFNHELNQILAQLRELGFTINETLIDATKPLELVWESEYPMDTAILDDIFVVAMKNKQYDFEKLADQEFKVLLDKGQSMQVSESKNNRTDLTISSGKYNRSIVDFFINYEFLVPLAVREI